MGGSDCSSWILHSFIAGLACCNSGQVCSPVSEMDLVVEHTDPEGAVFGQVELLDVGEQLLVRKQPLPQKPVLGGWLAGSERLIGQFLVGGKGVQGIAEIGEITLLPGLLRDPFEGAHQVATRWPTIRLLLNQSLIKSDCPAKAADKEIAPRAVVGGLVGEVKAAAKQGFDKSRMPPLRVHGRSVGNIRKSLLG